MGRKGSNHPAAKRELDLVKAFDLLTEALHVLKSLPPRTGPRSVHEEYSGALETRLEAFLKDPWRTSEGHGPKAKA